MNTNLNIFAFLLLILSSAVSAQNLPTLDPIPNQVTTVNVSPLIVNLEGISSGNDADQTITVNAAISSGDNIATISVDYTSPNSTGTITIDFVPGQLGAFTVDVTVSDVDGSLTRSFMVTVNPANQPPVASDDSYSINEDTPLTINAPGVLFNDSDPDGDPLTAVLVDNVQHGTLTLNADGSFTYTPAANYNGSDSFTYRASDGTLTSNIATVSITVNAVNDAPVVVDDSYSTDEDTPLTITAPGVLYNDTDPDGNPLTAVLVATVQHGTLTLNANGSFTYTPAANYNGSDSFTYRASDGTLTSNIATVTITVSAVNDAPVAVNDSYSTNEGTPLTVNAPGVLSNDTDPDGNPLTAILVDNVQHGTLTLNANGSFTYTPAANYNGSDSFSYRASDGTLTSNVATVTITVNAVNDPPVAVNDSYSTNEDTPLTINAPGVLYNDTDPDGDPLTAVLVATVQHGTLTLNADGSFTYTPAANYNGSDSFTYRASDGTLTSNIATVTITVNAVNQAPVAVNDSYSTDEDTPLTVNAPGVLSNDTDPDGDPLTAVLVATVQHGTLTFNTNGSFTYTPSANYNGSDSFTYRVSDGTLTSNIATVTITVNAVNDAPVAVNDSYAVNQNNVLNTSAPGLLSNDTDPDGDQLTAMLVATVQHGTLTLNANGSFTYTPAANYNGSDSFTYQASDGSLTSNVATVTITVNAVNDPPVAVNDSYSTNEDTPLTINAPGVLFNDSDPDGNPLTAVLVATVQHGTLTLNADGSFTYSPAANYNGSDSFTYRASDGTLTSNIATVTITVNAVNQAPVAVDDSYSANEDTPLTINAPGVLSNDSDPDGDPLTAVLVATVQHGTLTFNTNGSFTYTPSANYNGSDSFTYRASDGTLTSNIATVTITVTAVNDAPVAVNDSYSTSEDTPLIINAPGVLSNDSDPDGNPLTAVLVATVQHGTLTLNANGSFTYTPSANYNGSDSFTYRVSDGTLTSNIATVTITVSAVNDAPVAVNDSYSINEDTPLTVNAPGVLSNDTDPDGDPLTAVLVATVQHGTLTLNANGSFTYTPAANYNGSDSFTYRASDGTLTSNIATVTITVSAVNDAPVAVNDSYSINEDTPLTVNAPGVLSNDSDPDGDPLTAVLVATVQHGTLTFNTNGSFTYTPSANYNGSDSFTYRVSDGTLTSNIATVTITVNAVNDAPVAVNDSYSINEDTPLTVNAPGVLSNDTDPDGNPLTAVLVATVQHGTLSLNANGSFTYTPAANYNGSDSFTYRASDGTLTSNVATVTITVNAVNQAPVAVDDSFSTSEDTPLTVNAPGVLSNDSDPDGNPLTAVLVATVQHGTLTLNANGSFTYTPSANYNGSDSFTYRVSDGTLTSNIATVTITVSAVNDAPVAVNDSYSINEDTPLTVNAPGVLSNDSDPDGDPLTAVLVATVQHGTLTFNTNGSFTYTPSANYNGSDSFTYRVSDGTLTSNVATVSITVNAVNDAPVAVNDSYSMNQNSILSISSPGILGNDSDIDNDPLNAVLVSDVQHGTLVLYPSGSFSYTPTVGYSGVDSFTYRASDGSATSNIATVTITVNAVNQAPVAFNDSYTTNEDTPLSVPAPGVLSNDTDPENNNLTSILVTGVQHGTLTLNSNGSFTYTPSANYNGSDSFTYQASDGSLTSNVATVTITVNAVNDPPVAVNDNYSTDEDLVLSVAAPGILVNDTDVDGNTLTASLVQNVSFGTLSLAANGGFVYTPNLNYFGTDYFTYTVSDGVAVSNVATVTINIRSVNDAPVANANSYSTSEDVTLMVSSNGVLSNDTDVDNVRLYAVLGNSVANGMLTLNEDGTFTYIPNEDFNGTDNFTYRAFDGQLYSNYATVTITVNAVNDPPNVRDDEAFTSENTSVNINVLANDDDARDGSPGGINASTVAVTAQPQHGSVTRLSNNTFTYTPYSGFYGTDQFTYSVSDRGYPLPPLTRSATVTINVARLSPVANDDNVTIAEDTPIDINVTANDVDLDLNPASLSIISAPANGTATVVGTIVRYTPRQDYFGTDFFTYTVRDLANHISNVARVNITITPVPDPPVIRNSSFSTPENTALVIALSSIASDPENDIVPSTITFPTQPQHGTVSFASGNIRYQPASGYGGNDFFTVRVSDQTGLQSNIGEITIQVSNQSPDARDDNFTINEDNVGVFDVLANDTDPQNNINPSSLTIITAPVNGTAVVASGRINYTPNANFNGTDQLRYSISDNTGYSDQATVYITVLPVNDPPVAVNDVVTTPEDTPVDIYYLVNDYDVDNQIVPSSTIIVTAPTHGTAVLAGGGSVIRYTPALNYFGTDVIVYRIFDQAGASANGTINITITPVNDPPVAVDDEVELINETFKTFNPLANDSDPEGELDRGSLRITVNPEHGRATVATSTGLITYTPNAGFSGNDRLEYTVCDRQGLCASARVNIVVNRDNQPPVANNDQLLVNEDTPGVIFPLANDTDVNGNIDAGSLTIITAPSHGVAIINEADGSVEYTPSQDYFGSDSFVYRIYDLGNPPLSDTATVFITILPVNDSPVANDDMVVLFDNQRVTINVLDNDFDVEGDQLILQSIESHPLIVNEGNGVVVIQSDNIIHCGEFDIQYTVCDGQLCDDAVLTIVLHAFDSDSDGIPDYIEGMDDTDGDHIPDYLDLDSDNDGIPDSLEGGMNNECGRMPLDSDGDGIPDYLDSDSDNDGVLDSIEGIDDCDGDGIPNWRDAFDDCDVRPFIPELFTPNGDGVNDKFVIPEIEQYHGNELLIFNRWGVLVYHKVNYDNSWDGYANKNSSGNKLLPEDTYFYVFKTGIQNKVKKGTVYLKR